MRDMQRRGGDVMNCFIVQRAHKELHVARRQKEKENVPEILRLGPRFDLTT